MPHRPLGPHRESLTARQAAGVDDPEVLRQCQIGPRDAQGRLTVGLGLSGLYCAACSLTIESALQSVSGVSDVHVQSASQRARFRFDPTQSTLSDVVAAVQAVGYKAWPDAGVRHLNERLAAQRKLLWRLLVAWLCMMQVMMISTGQYVAGPQDVPPDLWRLMNWAAWVLTLPVLTFSCGPFFSGAWRGLRQGRVAMDLPVALGIAAMFGVSTVVTFGHTRWLGQEVFFDSLTMFVAFLLTGRWLEGRARERVTQSLESLSARLPEAVERAVNPPPASPGSLSQAPCETVPLSRVEIGDWVRVAVGQAFPADGLLVEGATEVDEALLTGESRPVRRKPGQLVVAGSLNLSAAVWMSVERLGPDTRYQQIVDLVHQALTEKPGWMRTADRFAGPFLVAVMALSALGGLAWWWIEPSRALWVAVSVLVVTCPCALSLAAPSALLAAAGRLARSGVLVRRLDAIEVLARTDAMLFDKTGTLTHPDMRVTTTWPRDPGRERLVHAASLAAHSQHPVSQAVVRSAESSPPSRPLTAWCDVEEIAGSGLRGTDSQGCEWRLGRAPWVFPAGPALQRALSQTAVRVWWAPWGASVDSACGFAIDEHLRDEAPSALRQLGAMGVAVSLLSGDQADRVVSVVQHIGGSPPVSVLAAEASPERKLSALVALQNRGHTVAVVGDGINDAPVLARAQVSFVMDQGAALAQSQADFLVLGGRLNGVPEAVRVSRQAMRVVRQNLVWSATYNFVCIPVALTGWMPPWVAGIGMALSSLAVVLNALRPMSPSRPDVLQTHPA